MSWRRPMVLLGLLVGVLVLVLAVLVTTEAPTGADAEAARVARGAKIYAAECATCHGVALEGAPNWRVPNGDGTLPAPPHDDSGHTWHHPDSMLFDYTKQGGKDALRAMGVTGIQSAMPAFGDRLSDQEIWDVLAFIKNSWSEKSRTHQANLTRQDEGS